MKLLLIGSLAAAAAMATSGPVVAQTETADESGAAAQIEEVVVTGSRLKRDSFNVSTPLVSVDNEMLQDAGLGSLQLALTDEVPSLYISSANTNTQSSIGHTGLTTVNLRGLGSNRTLILIDGRRTVANSYSGNFVSLNTIPRGMVERVEVVTGGSTATYGSDAIAGVVNIITEQDKEGFGFFARGGTTAEGGGDEYTLSADFGTSFASGRGYFFAGVTYDEEMGIDHRDRDRAQIEADFDYNTTLLCNEMQTETGDQCMRDAPDPADWRDRDDGTAGGVFSEGAGNWWFDENGLNTNWSEERDGLFARIWDVILIPNDTLAAAFKVNFDFTDRTTGYFQLQYSENNSFNFKSPENEAENNGVATIDPVTGLPGEVEPGTIASTNPFIPAGIINDPNFPAEWTGGWDRRMFEVGNITTDNERTTLRTWAGLRGTVFDDWDWDASIGYGEFEQVLIRSNEIDVRKEAQALDAGYAADGVTIQCNDPVARAEGCVPLNLFGEGSITPEMADWIRYTPVLNPTIEQLNFLAYMTGDLFDMPAGPVGAVFGFEYREDDMEMLADDGSNYGGISYNIVPDIIGSMDVAELFTEFSFPLHDSLTADIAARVADYSHENISTIFSYNAGLMWEIAEGYNFRANIARAQRAPDLTELYSPERGDYDGFTDICEEVSLTSTEQGHDNCRLEPAIAAAIAADPTFVFEDDNNGYSPSSGNPELFEETADTYTIGFSIAPSFLEGFQLAVDYYNIDIEDAIISVENSEILKQCYASSITLGDPNPFCDDITRDSEGQLIKIIQRQFNLNSETTSGFDVALDWVWNVGPGDLTLEAHWTRILDHEAVFEGNDGPELVDYNNQLEFNIFEDSATASLAYRFNDWRIRWRTAYKGPVTDINERVVDYQERFATNDARCAANDPACVTNPEVPAYLYYGSYTRHDLSVSYDMELRGGTALNLFGGARNLFDKDPFVPRTGDNSENGIGNYDSFFGGGIGRFYFLGAEMRFGG